jgi:hypothetical protein
MIATDYGGDAKLGVLGASLRRLAAVDAAVYNPTPNY